MSSIDEVFNSFCGPGKTDMDGKGFAKLVKDCHLLDKRFGATDVDLIFAKVVEKGHRRIDLSQFESALNLVAEKKDAEVSSVRDAVVAAGGPVLNGTKADAVRFHDDKSTYTGTHVNGGPESVPKGEGRVPPSKTLLTAGQNLLASPAPGTGAAAAAAAQRQKSPRPQQQAPAAGSVEAAFESYCAGQPGMDGKTFAKVCKDCHLLDKTFTPTDVDLIFAKVVPKGARRIDMTQFSSALEHVATKKKVGVEAVHGAISSSSGPVLHGTHADAVRFHDDKSTYTGVHQHGGPEAVAVGSGTATQLAANGMRTGQ